MVKPTIDRIRAALEEVLHSLDAMAEHEARHNAAVKSAGSFLVTPKIEHGAAQVPVVVAKDRIDSINSLLDDLDAAASFIASDDAWAAYHGAVNYLKMMDNQNGNSRF